jgi:hypothetical protein
MLRVRFLTLFAALALTGWSCGNESSLTRGAVSPAAPSARSTVEPPVTPPFTVQGSLPLVDAVASLRVESGGERLVLNTADGTAAIVRPALVDAANHRYQALTFGWSQDNELLISSEGATYTWNAVTGARTTRDAMATTTPFSTDTRSSDGSWRAHTDTTDEWLDTTVGETGAEPSFKLVRVGGVQWSPTEPNHLAALGNPCSGKLWDVVLFDVATGRLTSLTGSVPMLTNFLWRPNGKEIAIEAWGRGDLPSRVILVKTDGEQAATWVMDPAPRSLGPVPESWSPDGEQLLVRFEGGHGGLFCDRQSDWEPSAVERLRP